MWELQRQQGKAALHWKGSRWKGRRSGKECEAWPLSFFFLSWYLFYKKPISNNFPPLLWQRSSIQLALVWFLKKAYRTAKISILSVHYCISLCIPSSHLGYKLSSQFCPNCYTTVPFHCSIKTISCDTYKHSVLWPLECSIITAVKKYTVYV